MIEDDQAVDRVYDLVRHEAFTFTNPNRLRSVIGVFAMANLTGFHRPDGAGYKLLADTAIDLDKKNPQLASRLFTPLGRWRRFDEARQVKMKAELERALATEGLSRDSYEVVSKSLA